MPAQRLPTSRIAGLHDGAGERVAVSLSLTLNAISGPSPAAARAFEKQCALERERIWPDVRLMMGRVEEVATPGYVTKQVAEMEM